jgi:CHC2 zinc finger
MPEPALFEVVLDKNELKRRLPMRFVASELGVYFDGDGKALCPWHDDRSPSLEVWTGDAGTEFVSCHPCDLTEDVLGLIRKVTGCTFPEALNRAREMHASLPDGYEPPRTAPRSTNPSVWFPFVAQALERAKVKPWSDVVRSWGLGVGPNDELVLPHWNAQGVLTGCKMRAGGLKYSLEPSTYPDLYGAWFARTSNSVLLTEGESDCLTAAEAATHEGLVLDVRALPSGVCFPRDEWVAYLRSWEAVYVALDNDAASAPKTVAWLDALAPVGYPVNLPWETDLRETLGSGTTLRDILNLPVPS